MNEVCQISFTYAQPVRDITIRVNYYFFPETDTQPARVDILNFRTENNEDPRTVIPNWNWKRMVKKLSKQILERRLQEEQRNG